MKTQVGNFMVSTVSIESRFDKPHHETMVFRCNDSGKITDFTDLYVDKTFKPENVQNMHDRAIDWVKEQIRGGNY